MKYFSFKSILQSRYWMAVVAGLMLAISFPKFSVAGFAWIAPGLILFCGVGKNGRQQFWLGYSAGLSHFLTSLYWLLFIPFPAGAISGWLALSAYLALYPAVWMWLSWKVFEKFIPVDSSCSNFVERLLSSTWKQRAVWSLSSAVIWVALEMIMARMFSGFPWNFLGVSQYKIIPLIQVASVTGVYGISFLIVWFSVSLCNAGFLLVLKPKPSRAWSGEIILPALVGAVVFSVGASRISGDALNQRTIKVALVQPSIPQTLIFDPRQDEPRFAHLMELSVTALTNQPDVLIWPEASMPQIDEEKFRAITNLIASHQVQMIFGSDDMQIRENGKGGWETNYYNSSFLFSSEGRFVETYRKRRLVIFGEYIPLERWLPFMKWLTPIEGGFTSGPGPVPFRLDSPLAKTSVLICFEDAFPHYAREHVETTTDFLLNLTNDGWFGDSAAQWQHGVNAIFRAIENGLPLIRCTNNGLTCWADKFGRIRKIFADPSGDIHGPGFLIAEIPLLTPGEKRAPTFYNQHGDWFGWSCVVAAIGLAIVSRKTVLKTK